MYYYCYTNMHSTGTVYLRLTIVNTAVLSTITWGDAATRVGDVFVFNLHKNYDCEASSDAANKQRKQLERFLWRNHDIYLDIYLEVSSRRVDANKNKQ